MSAIIQHKSTFGSPQPSGVLSLTFDSPVKKGNLVIVAAEPGVGNASLYPTSANISDSQGNNWSVAVGDPFNNTSILFALAKASGTLTVTFTQTAGNYFMGLHIYEVQGYDTLDQIGHYDPQFDIPSTATISTDGATVHANEFVFAYAGWRRADGNLVPDVRSEGSESTADQSGYLFLSFGFEVTQTGVQTATSTDSTDTSGGFDDGIMCTFYNSSASSGGSDNSTLVFLGSVSETSDDSGGTQYIGHVKVINAPRAGAANPYLGKIKKVTVAPAGLTDPFLGEVVIVSGPPNGFQGKDSYLGHVKET